MDIKLILFTEFSGSEWALTGNTYESLQWFSDTAKPTEAQLEALWPTVEYETEHATVEKARKQSYTETSDPLYFEWQRGDATEQEWLDAVQAVKTAHPYPTPPGK